MRGNYDGLPAAASVEQAIVLAQLLIVRDLERRTVAVPRRPLSKTFDTEHERLPLPGSE